jgi:S-adenosylmethionine/arginine decarboxylase-like enzyme
MYMIDDMIDMGLEDGQKWPTKAHRAVAQNLALCNPMITTRDALTEIVQKVCSIPKTEIKKVKFTDLPKYGIALVVAP